MRHLLALAVGMVLVESTGATQESAEAADRLRASAIAGKDRAALARLVVDDVVIVDRNGALRTKRAEVEAAASGRAASTVERDVVSRPYGDAVVFMGRSSRDQDGATEHDVFSRIWMRLNGMWRMVAEHHTDITPAIGRGTFYVPSPLSQPRPIAPRRSRSNADAEVRRAINEQHRAYWSKDPDRYRRYAGVDLLRIAENGIRPREELINGMRANARLPATPSAHLDVQVHVYGNSAVTTWLDEGVSPRGDRAQNRFTVLWGWRDGRWQMVHMQSTGVKPR